MLTSVPTGVASDIMVACRDAQVRARTWSLLDSHLRVAFAASETIFAAFVTLVPRTWLATPSVISIQPDLEVVVVTTASPLRARNLLTTLRTTVITTR